MVDVRLLVHPCTHVHTQLVHPTVEVINRSPHACLKVYTLQQIWVHLTTYASAWTHWTYETN